MKIRATYPEMNGVGIVEIITKVQEGCRKLSACAFHMFAIRVMVSDLIFMVEVQKSDGNSQDIMELIKMHLLVPAMFVAYYLHLLCHPRLTCLWPL